MHYGCRTRYVRETQLLCGPEWNRDMSMWVGDPHACTTPAITRDSSCLVCEVVKDGTVPCVHLERSRGLDGVGK